MDKIILKDFEVLACHGVNPEEKVNKQRFIFTAVIDADFQRASDGDDIDKTVSYAAVKKEIKAFCEDNCFNLIETLATRLAERILKKFPLARGIELTVKKPDAPMSGSFDYAGVRVERRWRRVYLSLGSSEGDRDGYLDFAIASLKADDNFSNVRESSRLSTEPYGGVAKQKFLNSAVECDTLYSASRLLDVIHKIESEGGRVRKERWADRTLDIDIIFYDNQIISEPRLCVPHPDLQNRYFVLAPLCELNANILHPVLSKRVGELLKRLESDTIC